VTNMRNRWRLPVLIIVIVFMGKFIADGWATEKNDYETIYIDQFINMMDQKDFFLINVHVPYYGEIAMTDLHVPFNAIEQHKNELPGDKNARIVVYCMMGPMGDIASEKLVNMGYTRVSNFQGGMMAWTQAGNHLQKRSK